MVERLPNGKWPQMTHAVDRLSDRQEKSPVREIAEREFHSAVQKYRDTTLDDSGVLPSEPVREFLREAGASVKMIRLLDHRYARVFYDDEMFERFVMTLPELSYEELRKAITEALEGDAILTRCRERHGSESIMRVVGLVSSFNSFNRIR